MDHRTGHAAGLIVGAIPGFSAANTIIILLPLTFAMEVEQGVVFMVALYASSRMGASIPAILVNIPGTAGAAATPLDGYPMARAGMGQQALAMSFVASTAGGLLTTIIALIAMPWLAQVAFFMHSVEMIVVMLFGISLIATIAAKNTLKGLIAGLFGLMIGAVGTDFVYETPRATFGFLELYDGIPLVPALVGLFAISEAFLVIQGESILTRRDKELMANPSWKASIEGIRMCLQRWWHVTWCSLIGLVIGVIPGAGASIASFVAYQQSRSYSKTPELYGTGHPEGLIAPEAANNEVTSGTLVPLMVIGFGIFMAMAVTYLLMIFTILPLSRYMTKVTIVSTSFMAPVIISFTLVGSFVPREFGFDMGLALGFGVLGYIARRTNYHVAAILIGIILGPLLEQFFLRAIRMTNGDLTVLFSSRIGNGLWIALVVTIALPYVLDHLRERRRRRETA